MNKQEIMDWIDKIGIDEYHNIIGAEVAIGWDDYGNTIYFYENDDWILILDKNYEYYYEGSKREYKAELFNAPFPVRWHDEKAKSFVDEVGQHYTVHEPPKFYRLK